MWDESLDEPQTPLFRYSLTQPPLPAPPANALGHTEWSQTIRDNPHLFQIVTPIKVDIFIHMLRDHPNQPFIRSVERVLREGAWPWANVPDSYPSVWDNSSRPLKDPRHEQIIEEAIDVEIAAGRFSEPFSDLSAGMYSAPMHVVPKPHTNPPKFRVVHDYSAGLHSCNSMIPKHERSTPLDTVQHLGQKIRKLRRDLGPDEALLIWKSDIANAYRIIPLHPLWQLKQVVTWKGKRMIDRCNMWGGGAAGRLLAAIASCAMWILWITLEITSREYVDDVSDCEPANDLVIYQPYGKLFPRGQATLLRLWDTIGFPHAERKQLWGSSLEVTGFWVDPNAMTITMEATRKNELLHEITNFVSKKRQPLGSFQRLTGWLNWALNVAPVLRPALACMYEKMQGKVNPQQAVWLNNKVKRDLMWFHAFFTRSSGIFLIDSVAWNADEADMTLWGDACPSGLGFFSKDLSVGFTIKPPAELPSEIYFLEAYTVLCQIHWASSQAVPPKKLVVYSDNTNTVSMFYSMRGKGYYNGILFIAAELLVKFEIDLRVVWLRGSANPIADALSRRNHHVLNTCAPGLVVNTYLPPEEWAERISLSAPLPHHA